MKHDTYMGFVVPKPKSAYLCDTPGCHYPVENDGDMYCKYCIEPDDRVSTDPSLISGHPDEFKDREENADIDF